MINFKLIYCKYIPRFIDVGAIFDVAAKVGFIIITRNTQIFMVVFTIGLQPELFVPKDGTYRLMVSG